LTCKESGHDGGNKKHNLDEAAFRTKKRLRRGPVRNSQKVESGGWCIVSSVIKFHGTVWMARNIEIREKNLRFGRYRSARKGGKLC